MLSRSIRRSLLDGSIPLPPTFLLPCRARFINSISHTTSPDAIPEPPVSSGAHISPKPINRRTPIQNSSSAAPGTAEQLPPPTTISPSNPTTPLSSSIKSLLPSLRAQPPHYIVAHLHSRPYLITTGDIIRLPFLMPGVSPGDVLRLNRATTLGSRDYTLKAGSVEEQLWNGKAKKKQGYVDERLFVCRAVVMGTESEPMRFKEKTKQRQRRVKTVRSKHRYTILKVKEVTVRRAEDVEGAEEG
ncbi:MAG: hypothetical protein M1820_004216 [Bogoriella megaspora]|nr:MAG: hypothetical protein M1820_004216 [Bogoriella megaspora]